MLEMKRRPAGDRAAKQCDDKHFNSLISFQTQLIASRFGLAADRAELIAGLAFGGAQWVS